ncbi:MAG: phosphatidate cytidylyltransferase [Sphingomonas sp.]
MSKKSDLGTRLVVAVVLIGLAFAALRLGGFAFWLVIVVAAVLMMGEWADLSNATPQQKRLSQYALSVPLAILCPFAAGPGFFALGLLAGAFFFVAIVSRNVRLAAGTLYVGLPVFALLLLRAHPDGFLVTLWTMAVVWACDTGAYFAGRAIGGPKLAPAISPNKTWAGFVGGVVAALLFTLALVYLNPGLMAGSSMVLLSPWLAMLAQGGDLFESYLKRVAGVKDSGNLLPGHGGLLDRLDGLVPVAPVAAIFIAIQYASTTGGTLWW